LHQPQFRIGIVATALDPLAKVQIAAVHGVAGKCRRCGRFHDGGDARSQFLADLFIGIKRKNPIASRLGQGGVFLWREPLPRLDKNFRAVGLRKSHGSIRAAGIYDDHLVGDPFNALQSARNVRFFVASDDADGQGHGRRISAGSVKYENIPATSLMDYRKQEAYLRSSRVYGANFVLVFLVIAGFCLGLAAQVSARLTLAFALVALALASSLYYTPDYLHLTVVPDKEQRWQVKIRWRIVAAVLVLGLLLSFTNEARISVVAAAAWLALCNLLIRKLAPLRLYAVLFWTTDLVLMAGLLLAGEINLALGSLLLSAAVHLVIVTGPPRAAFAARIDLWGILAIVFSWRLHHSNFRLMLACAGLLIVSALVSFVLVNRAGKQNQLNVAAAMNELVEFTGYTPGRIRELWEISNQQLAKNWEVAAIRQDDRERMAEWYRQNSELYLFAISAYNLEYKRIKSNLKVIR